MWLFPILYALYTSLRPYEATAERGYASIGGPLNFDNYSAAWTGADLPHYYFNSLIVTVPAIVLTLRPGVVRGLHACRASAGSSTWRC